MRAGRQHGRTAERGATCCRSAVLSFCRASLLLAATIGQTQPAVAQDIRLLTPSARAKAEHLIRDRLPCLGCHKLDDDGGIIGPDLSVVGDRRSADFIRRMITDPQGTLPGTRMPKTPMPDAWRDLVVSYLAGRRTSGSAVGSRAAAPLLTPPPVPPDPSAATLYARTCEFCHGDRGEADGFNAPYLPVKPTAHADSAYMATRPDDTLFDAIYGGGYIVNRSHRMPAFGATFSRKQIWELVRYLRELCRCEGPAWSRDGTR